MAGALFENYVVSEVVKSYWHRGRQAPLWFFRTKDGLEVDLVIEEEGRLHPIEVKLTARPTPAVANGIARLSELTAVGRGAVVCMTDRAYPLTPQVDALPVGAIE